MDEDGVKGAEDFLKLSKALKAAGRTELRKELHKSMRTAARPLIPKSKAAARSLLPQRGGLAKEVARSPHRVQVRTGAQTAGVRIAVSNSRSGARAANRGLLRHPVFAKPSQSRRQWTWVTQKIPAGWFDKTMQHEAPRVARPALERAMQAMADRIVQEVKRG